MSDTSEMRHPDSAIRLASSVHRMRVPKITKDPASEQADISFRKSFQTVGQHPTTHSVMFQADENRDQLSVALDASNISGERVVENSKKYLPLINQILLSCKVQPEVARLDIPLEFSWISGLEKEENEDNNNNRKKQRNATPTLPKHYTSNAIMYDLVMTMVSEGLGHAAKANEAIDLGDYAAANREYKAATSVFHSLAQNQLPEWTSKCTTTNVADDEALPLECSIIVAETLAEFFKAQAQQMAITTVLNKPDQPNYGLLAKLCWGVADELDKSVNKLRAKAFHLLSRMDPEIFAAIKFQSDFHRALSVYCQARNQWDTKAEHGIAIALLKRCWTELTALKKSAKAVADTDVVDVVDFLQHIEKLLTFYETENSTIYFETVPTTAMALQKFEEGVLMGKVEDYALANVDPLPLIIPPKPEPVVVPQAKKSGLFGRIAKIAGR